MRAAAHRGTMPPPPQMRPKIKIIHIIAPEIIKTDVAHFRDLVQQLTGKPAACAISSSANYTAPVEEEIETTTNKRRLRPAPAPAPVAADEMSDFMVQEEPIKKRKIKCEVKVEQAGGFGDYDLDRSDLWMDLNPGGFLSFLEEEGVFQGLAADHDFLQPAAFASSRMDLVGEMYAS